MKLWLYADRSGWGRALLPPARARGHDAAVFDASEMPHEGVVFARIHHHPEVRARDKAMMVRLAGSPRLRLIPSARAARLYDDKVAQARELGGWMPATVHLTDPADVEAAIERLGLPLMSKSAEGAGSYNVRLLQTRAAALDEAAAAFGVTGLKLHYGQRQGGYLLWQEFLAGNAYDFRVIAVGGERLILRRGNRADRPMASGSGIEMPVTFPDPEAESALAFADRFFAAEAMRFCGIDLVKDRRSDEWRLLECTTGWPLSKMHEHRFVSGRRGRDFWAVVLDAIEAGAC